MPYSISLLGSTGSIGTQALDVARKNGYRIKALAAEKSVQKIEEQIREFLPEIAVLRDEQAANDLRIRVKDLPVKVLSGEEGVLEAARYEADFVLNSIVGIAGLRSTLAAIEEGRTLALANKESLVTGGELVTKRAEEKGVKILPVDSEHSAIFQCLQASPPNNALNRLILTASGGPFFGKTRAELEKITPEDALKHPTWNMGSKITIDSATLMNKGLEIIEAVWLFGLPQEKIDVVVHRESVIHSMIEFCDYSVLAQMGVPDMKLPIQYALTWPERYPCPTKQLKLTDYAKLTFYEPDAETFKCLQVCRDAISRGGLVPTVANGANEAAVELFLKKKISFLQIGELVGEAAARQSATPVTNVEDVFEADRTAREFVYGAI